MTRKPTLDVDVSLEFWGRAPLYISGHIVSFGVMGDRIKLKCADCGVEYGYDNHLYKSVKERSTDHIDLIWMYYFYPFTKDSCSGDRDSWEEIVKEDIMMDYIGRPKNGATKRDIARDVEQLFGGAQFHNATVSYR